LTAGSTSPRNDESARLIHREIVQLLVLIVFVAGAFFLTRAIAASNRETTLRDAADSYERGRQQLAAGDAGAAVASLRRAVVKDRANQEYAMALARALAADHQDAAATAVLLALRDSAPDSPDINLALARLFADRGDAAEATRYYHNALYAPWLPEQMGARRQVRVELIRFFLERNLSDRALPELLALSNDLPDDPNLHVEAGQLFAAAGDDRRALGRFQRALSLAPANQTAQAAAGEAAFRIGEYKLAQRYLDRVSEPDQSVLRTRTIVDLVLSNDPLAPRIGAAERRWRLLANLEAMDNRLQTCNALAPAGSPGTDDALLGEAQKLETMLKTARVEDEAIEPGVNLTYRMAQAADRRCPPATALDEAVVLVARQHGADQQ
jgi:tetratricopeptide (TPR) repeat protein